MNPIPGSETSAAAHLLAPYCQGMGLDLGYGGLPVVPHAITVDLNPPYNWLKSPQHLTGDVRNLYWFKDGAMDWVYSSHVLEDFPPTETMSVIREWLRVVKKGGRLILLLPDEPVYMAHCAATGQPYNQAHQNHELTLDWFTRNIVPSLQVEIEYSNPLLNIYSFAIVMKKL